LATSRLFSCPADDAGLVSAGRAKSRADPKHRPEDGANPFRHLFFIPGLVTTGGIAIIRCARS
jgi:hypothetical protein